MGEFNLEQRRKELNLTLEQIGNYVGVNKSTVKKWETGYIDNMKRDKIALLAEILQISPLTILGVNDTQSNSLALDKNEKKLINNYRLLPEKGKKYVLQAAEMAVNTYTMPREVAAGKFNGTEGTYKKSKRKIQSYQLAAASGNGVEKGNEIVDEEKLRQEYEEIDD